MLGLEAVDGIGPPQKRRGPANVEVRANEHDLVSVAGASEQAGDSAKHDFHERKRGEQHRPQSRFCSF